jgi:hypothetical protein
MFEFVKNILDYLFCVKRYRCTECEEKFIKKLDLINHLTHKHEYYYDSYEDKFYNTRV